MTPARLLIEVLGNGDADVCGRFYIDIELPAWPQRGDRIKFGGELTVIVGLAAWNHEMKRYDVALVPIRADEVATGSFRAAKALLTTGLGWSVVP